MFRMRNWFVMLLSVLLLTMSACAGTTSVQMFPDQNKTSVTNSTDMRPIKTHRIVRPHDMGLMTDLADYKYNKEVNEFLNSVEAVGIAIVKGGQLNEETVIYYKDKK